MQTHEWEELLYEIPADHLPGKSAVIEVIRLRKAIAAARDDCRRSAEVEAWLSQFAVAPLAPVFNDLVDALTRILEGDTNA